MNQVTRVPAAEAVPALQTKRPFRTSKQTFDALFGAQRTTVSGTASFMFVAAALRCFFCMSYCGFVQASHKGVDQRSAGWAMCAAIILNRLCRSWVNLNICE
ncbi:MAG: hypothetical protein FJX47_18110 [Alphaproteobacteria bacterium]|nr:hypothetical protein [Alphaproteobacteria bacterium]